MVSGGLNGRRAVHILEGVQKMTTCVPNTTASVEDSHIANEAPREWDQWRARRHGPRRLAFVCASGFILGSVAATVASLVGGQRRMPFVLGNRNVFVSLPFSGISMVAPSVRTRGARRRQRGGSRGVPMRFAAWSDMTLGGKKRTR